MVTTCWGLSTAWSLVFDSSRNTSSEPAVGIVTLPLPVDGGELAAAPTAVHLQGDARGEELPEGWRVHWVSVVL